MNYTLVDPSHARKPVTDPARRLAELLAQARRERVDVGIHVDAIRRTLERVDQRLDQR